MLPLLFSVVPVEFFNSPTSSFCKFYAKTIFRAAARLQLCILPGRNFSLPISLKDEGHWYFLHSTFPFLFFVMSISSLTLRASASEPSFQKQIDSIEQAHASFKGICEVPAIGKYFVKMALIGLVDATACHFSFISWSLSNHPIRFRIILTVITIISETLSFENSRSPFKQPLTHFAPKILTLSSPKTFIEYPVSWPASMMPTICLLLVALPVL